MDVGLGRGFDDYVRARSDGLLRLAWLVTRDWEDARDAVQDALFALYPRWERLPEANRREAYISRTVVNACLAVIRRRRSHPVADPAELPQADRTGDHAGPIANACRSGSPATASARRLQVRCLRPRAVRRPGGERSRPGANGKRRHMAAPCTLD